MDDRLEIFIPGAALTVMIHVMVAALTFVDVDANHKYHDFSGGSRMGPTDRKVGLVGLLHLLLQ